MTKLRHLNRPNLTFSINNPNIDNCKWFIMFKDISTLFHWLKPQNSELNDLLGHRHDQIKWLLYSREQTKPYAWRHLVWYLANWARLSIPLIPLLIYSWGWLVIYSVRFVPLINSIAVQFISFHCLPSFHFPFPHHQSNNQLSRMAWICMGFQITILFEPLSIHPTLYPTYLTHSLYFASDHSTSK